MKPTTFLFAALLLGFSPRLTASQTNHPIPAKIDWPQFMARHDLIWEQLPTSRKEAPHFGNGRVGSMLLFGGSNTIKMPVFRNDVQDHRDNSWGWTAYSRPRLVIGEFNLHPVGKVIGCDLRQDLWNAELTGTIKTDQGEIGIRHYVHANDMAIVTELRPTAGEKDCRWEWVPAPSATTRGDYVKKPEDRAAFAAKYGDQYANVKIYEPNPPGQLEQKNSVSVWTQNLLSGGQYAVAWSDTPESGGKRILMATIAKSYPAATAADHAVKDMNAFRQKQMTPWTDEHRQWWHDYYRQSFVSLPETRLESAYWGMIYRMACCSRTGRGIIDTSGIWFFPTGWPYTTMDYNIQVAYWGVYAANRLNIGGSLIDMLHNNKQALTDNVRPVEWQVDSSYLDVTSAPDLIAPRSQDKRYSLLVGLLPWVLNNAWMQYRYSMDEAILRDTVYPLLVRSMNFYFHLAQNGPDGKLRLPPTYSPEKGVFADCNFDLALMRWGCQTLLWSANRLKIDDPLIPKWKDALARLPEVPHGNTGLMFGADSPYDGEHRHGSHMMAVYPLHLMTIEQPENSEIVKRSATDFASSRSRLMEMVSSHAAPAAAVAGLPELAYRRILWNDDDLEPGGFNQQWCIEGSLAIANNIQQLLIQSWGDKIRVFPAMPKAWPDAVFEDLRTEGAFLVSARYAAGKTQWVRIKSLAGEPCRVMPNLAGKVRIVSGDEGVQLKEISPGLYELKLAKNQQLTLAGEQTPGDWSIAPLPAQVNRVNSFGLSKTSEQYRKDRLKEAFTQLGDPDPLLQWSGVRIVGRKGTANDILPLLKAGLALKDAEAKATIPEVISDLLSRDRAGGLKALRQAVDDPELTKLAMPILCQFGTVDDLKLAGTKAAADPMVRRIALGGLSSRKTSEAGPILLDLYKLSANAPERAEIAKAYLTASRNQKTPEARRKMLEEAVGLIEEPEALKELKQELSRGNTNNLE